MRINFQIYLREKLASYLRKRIEILERVIQIRNGDNGLMAYIYSGVILNGQERVDAMLRKEFSDLRDLDSRIVDFCQKYGFKNPL